MSVHPCVHASTKSFFDFNEIWLVGRGRWVMHDGMQYDYPRSRSRALQSWKSFHLFCYLQCELATDHWFLTRRRRKILAHAWILFARLFNTQEQEHSTSKQFLIIYTSTSSSLNFGTIVVNYFLIRPEFIQSGFKCVSRLCIHNVIRYTVPHNWQFY